MKIYLLTVAERHIFYAECREAPDDAEARGGIRGWLGRKSRALQEALHRAEGRFGVALRRAWEWLQRQIAPDEALLRHLRKASRVVLHHPSDLAPEEVRAGWDAYLAARQHRHLVWLVVDALIAPLTLLLALLPGPNVVGYWFVYRAVCHALAVLGIRRARRMKPAVHVQPGLDRPPGGEDGDLIARACAHCGLDGLGEFLARSGVKPGVAAEAGCEVVAGR